MEAILSILQQPNCHPEHPYSVPTWPHELKFSSCLGAGGTGEAGVHLALAQHVAATWHGLLCRGGSLGFSLCSQPLPGMLAEDLAQPQHPSEHSLELSTTEILS